MTDGVKLGDVPTIERIEGDEKLPITDGGIDPLTITIDLLIKETNVAYDMSTGEKLYIKIITGVHSKDAVNGEYEGKKIGPECLCFTTDGKIVFNNIIYK